MSNLNRANLLGAATGAGIAAANLIAPAIALASPNSAHKLSANGPALSTNLGRASMELNTVLEEMGPNSCLAVSLGDEMGIRPSDTSERAQLITSGGLRVVARITAQNEAYPDELACHSSAVKKAANETSTQDAFKIAFSKVPAGSQKDFKNTARDHVLKTAVIDPSDEAVLSTSNSTRRKATVTDNYNVNVSYGVNKAAEQEGAAVEDCSSGYVVNSNISSKVETAIQAKLGDIYSNKHSLKGDAPFPKFQKVFNSIEKTATSTVTATANNSEDGIPICLENLNPQSLSISSEVESQLQMHEGWVPSQGCSAYIFYNGQTPVGIAMARHCFEDENGNLNITEGANNQPEINLYSPLIVATGQSTGQGEMDLVGTVSELEIGTDNTNDFVFGALGNYTIADVKALYAQQALTQAQIKNLSKGTEMVDAGYTAFQGTNTGAAQLQSVAESLIGFSSFGLYAPGTTTVSENLQVMNTAAIKNADGAAATPGISGSGLDAVVNNQVNFVGVATGLKDFDVLPAETSTPAGQEQGLENEEEMENEFGVNLSGFDEEAEYSYTPPAAGDGVEDVATNVDSSNSTLPASAELNAYEFVDNFFNSGITRYIINGLVDMNGIGWVDNPSYTYDPNSGTLTFGLYDNGGLNWYNWIGASQSLSNLTVYANPDESAPTLATSTGSLETNTAADAFTDGNGLNISQTFSTPPTPSGDAYTIAMGSNNQPYFTVSESGESTPTNVESNASKTTHTSVQALADRGTTSRG